MPAHCVGPAQGLPAGPSGSGRPLPHVARKVGGLLGRAGLAACALCQGLHKVHSPGGPGCLLSSLGPQSAARFKKPAASVTPPSMHSPLHLVRPFTALPCLRVPPSLRSACLPVPVRRQHGAQRHAMHAALSSSFHAGVREHARPACGLLQRTRRRGSRDGPRPDAQHELVPRAGGDAAAGCVPCVHQPSLTAQHRRRLQAGQGTFSKVRPLLDQLCSTPATLLCTSPVSKAAPASSTCWEGRCCRVSPLLAGVLGAQSAAQGVQGGLHKCLHMTV